jgi:hypothetical protein
MKPLQTSAENAAVEEILNRYDGNIPALAFQLREFLLTHLENITEQADQSANIVGYGYGHGYKEMICTIMLSKKGVKLGFYKGTELPDPAHLLKGTGKVHKFVEIHSAKDLRDPALKNLLKEALKAYQKRKTGG